MAEKGNWTEKSGLKKLGYLGMLAVVAISAALTTSTKSAVAASGYECRDQALGPITIPGNLTVPANHFCNLNGTQVLGNATVEPASDPTLTGGLLLDSGAHVHGNVHVEQNGNFAAFNNSIVDGNLQCNHCLFADYHDSTLMGSLQDNGLSEGADIKGSTIGGILQIHNGVDVSGFGYQIAGNSIGGNLLFMHNTGASNISGNQITRILDCEGNSPPPTGGGNTAQQKQGQCALF